MESIRCTEDFIEFDFRQVTAPIDLLSEANNRQLNLDIALYTICVGYCDTDLVHAVNNELVSCVNKTVKQE